MAVETSLNEMYIKDVVWEVRTTLNGLNDKAGLSSGYIYRLLEKGGSEVTMSTVDKLHNALEALMLEQGKNPPDDLWDRLITHKET